MPNSIVDHDNARAFALHHHAGAGAGAAAPADHQFPTAAFDEVSSTSSNREDFLLVLVSSMSGSATQTSNQKRALTILDACSVQPEVLDAADPANALVRDELFEMSGIRGNFPQFFLVQGDRTSFFADFCELEHMNEEGTLAEWLGMEIPIRSKNKLANGNANTNTYTNTYTNANTTVDRSRDDFMKDQGSVDVNVDGMEPNGDYAATSTTEDLFNVADVTKILSSMDKSPVPDVQKQNLHYDKNDDENNNDIILSISTASTKEEEEEWSDPLLLERYEDEILALEDFLQEREEQEGEQQQQQQQRTIQDKTENQGVQQKRDKQAGKLEQGKYEGDDDSDACIYENSNLHPTQSLISDDEDSGERTLTPPRSTEKNRPKHEHKHMPVSSLSSIATTATITPTSSSSPSRSPDKHRRYINSTNNNSPSPLPSPLSTSLRHKNNDKNISWNVSMETVSTRSETEHFLQAEVEDLRQKCEQLTAERYIMEGQLKEARNKNEERSRSNDSDNDNGKGGAVHKFQLQQTMRCGFCMKVFKSSPSSLNTPIASQACGHSICRNCCHQRLSSSRKAARRRRDQNSLMDSSERLRSTISSDLFMCGADMDQVYSAISFDEQSQHDECESCPICRVPKAFRHGKLHVNESLCVVLQLLDR